MSNKMTKIRSLGFNWHLSSASCWCFFVLFCLFGLFCTEAVDECKRSRPLCENGGTCLNHNGTFMCICMNGWTGVRCESNIDDCADNPCNGGTCIDRVGSYMCDCPKEKTGLQCQYDNQCMSNPCHSEARCETSPINGTYVCSCRPGWKGTDCKEDIDECRESVLSPCEQRGICRNTLGSFRCDCDIGLTGTRCENNINECDSSPCQNEGSCLDKTGLFQCLCMDGFTGIMCETRMNECASGPCANGGTCFDRVGYFQCNCQSGYTGALCETKIPMCQSNPCQYGGNCTELTNGYVCHCPPGTSGNDCAVKTDDCRNRTCANGGVCRDDGSRYSCRCSEGYTGPYCEFTGNRCNSNPCQHGGTCRNESGSYFCQCAPGFTGVNCETNRNDCSPNPCQNGGQCIDGIEGYWCTCAVPYTGPNCSEMVLPCKPSFCQNEGKCVPDASNTDFTCECAPGYTGSSCSEDVNECASGNPCRHGGTCRNNYGSFTCSCPLGYSGSLCNGNQSDCVSVPCQNGGTCVDGLNNYTCQCVPGYNGYNCQFDINECLSLPCINGATCHNYVNSYTCTCAPGFSGTNCHINDNDCSASLCLNGGTCVDGVDAYSCRCPSGYSGSHCEHQLTACDSNPCLNDGSCRASGQTYTCICTSGWKGQNCNEFVDWCNEETPICQNGGNCTQDANEFHCTCPVSWTGQRCDIRNVTCQVEASFQGVSVANMCKNNGSCRNTGSSHECLCRPGYSGSYCQNKINNCTSQPCYNGASCTELDVGYSCSCIPGFTGANCETNIDECLSSPCRNNGTCHDQVNSFQCSCLPGTSGVRCELNPNDCQPSSCLNGGTCFDKINGFDCVCPLGFTGSNCQGDIDECLSRPCSGPGVLGCVQGIGSFVCLCKHGWTGQHCQTYLNPCMDSANTCLNGGSCVDSSGPDSFVCECPPGYSGSICETASCENNPCQNKGTCNVTGGRFECQCLPDYTGTTCENVNNNGAICEINSCKEKANNNRCDPECDAYMCLYDNYECSYTSSIYKNCEAIKNGIPCYTLINDGLCDSACNNENCLYDGWDCKNLTVCNPIYDAYCKSHHKDGNCDQGCNNEECGWDGLDCSDSKPDYAKDVLVIIVLVPYEVFVNDSVSFLRNLSLLLHGTLVIKKDDNGRDMIYRWPDETLQRKKRAFDWDFGEFLVRTKRLPQSGTKFLAKLDNTNCKSQCFPSAELAAEFLAQAVREGYNPGYTLYSVSSLPDPSSTSPTPTVPVVVAMVAIILVAVVVVFGVLEARKRRHGKTWFPEGFCAFPPARGIPDEQDSSKRVIPSSSSSSDAPGSGAESMTTVSDSCSDEESVYHSKPKRRKSEKEDSREWTRIHLEAAGTIPKPALLAFTPPQNDLYEIRNINVRGPGGLTPLMLASMASTDTSLLYDPAEGPASVITDLINDGASIQSKTDHTGETPLHLAARYSRSDAAKRLLDAGADPNVQDNLGRTPLHSAVVADAVGVFQILLRHRSTTVNARMKDGTTPLILAVRLAMEGMVEELINSDADVGATDELGKTALHWAAAVNNVSAATLLLRHGANKDAQDDRSQTPLFMAAREGSRDVVILLLQNSASIDIPDHVDHLPRDVAFDRCHHDIVQLLDNCSFNQASDGSCGGGAMGGVMSYMSQMPKNKQKRPSRKQRVPKDSECHKIEHCLQYPPHMSGPFIHLPLDSGKKSKRKPIASSFGMPSLGLQSCLHTTSLGNALENRAMEYPPPYDQMCQGHRQQFMAQANLPSLSGTYMDAGLALQPGTYHNKMMMVGEGGAEQMMAAQGWFPLESGQNQLAGGRETDMWMGHASSTLPDSEAFNYDAYVCQQEAMTSFYPGKQANSLDVFDPCNFGMYHQEGNIAVEDPAFSYGCLDEGLATVGISSHTVTRQFYDQPLSHTLKTSLIQSHPEEQNSFPNSTQLNSSPGDIFDLLGPLQQSPQLCTSTTPFNPCNVNKTPISLNNSLDNPPTNFVTTTQSFVHPGVNIPPDSSHQTQTYTKPIKHVPPLSQFTFPQHSIPSDVSVLDNVPSSGVAVDSSRPSVQKPSFPTPPSNHGQLSDTPPQQLPGCMSRELYPTPSPDSLGPWSNSPTQSAKSDWSDKIKNSPHQPKGQQTQGMGSHVKEEPSSFFV